MLNDADPHIAQVVRRAQQGDHAAFALLYQQYGVSVLRTAYLLLADMGLAEDVTQEVFVQVYRKFALFQPARGTFAAWIYRITVNQCLKTRQRRRGWLAFSDTPPLRDSVPAESPSPLDAAVLSDEQRRIWRCVGQLSLKLRTAVVLRYYHDLSYAEIAEILECPIGTVRSRLAAAHAQLERALEES